MNKVEKIILGTVQLGLPYGVNNTNGKPGEKDAFEILELAKKSGISMLDTAEAYGNSIEIIGKYHQQNPYRFNIISKFKFSTRQELKESIKRTIDILHIEKLFAYLLHDPAQLFELEINDAFTELKESGLINHSGVSIYTNEQFEQAVAIPYIDIIQIPYNVLDNKYRRGALIKKAKENNKIIHVRSVFLQGLFFMKEEAFPLKLQPLQKYILTLNELCNKYAISKEAFALNYALDNNDIEGVLIGVDSTSQLLKNIEASKERIPAELTALMNKIIVKETELLNPANWN